MLKLLKIQQTQISKLALQNGKIQKFQFSDNIKQTIEKNQDLVDANKKERNAYQFIGQYLMPFNNPNKELREQLYKSYLLLLTQKVCFFASPLMLKYGINSLQSTQNPSQPFIYFLSFGVFQCISHVSESKKNQLLQKISLKSWKQISIESFEHLLKQDVKFLFNTSQRERLFGLYRGHQAIEKNCRIMLQFLLPIFLDFSISSTYLFLNFGPEFVFSFFGTFSAFTVFTLKTSKSRRPVIKRQKQLEKKADAIISETMANYYTVKYFNAEKKEEEKYSSALDAYILQTHRVNKGLWDLNSGQRVIFSTGMCLNLLLSAYKVQMGLLTVGDVVLLQTLMMSLLTPLNLLGSLYREYTDSFYEIKEIFSLLNNKPTVKEAIDAKQYEYKKGSIRFEKVDFVYDKNPIIQGLDLEIEGGRMVSVVGESGSGKTTILSLLFRFYDPCKGSVYLDGQDLKTLQLDHFRQQIGVVGQNTYLFNESIYYNLVYGQGDQKQIGELTEEQKERVHYLCQRLGLHDYILSLPEGYNTKLGEQGLKFSGGQRQRLAIARCLMKQDMKVLLLDEATSAIDSHNEKLVMQLIRDEQTARGLTVVLTTHRLHLNIYAQEVIVLQHTQPPQRGTHSTLLNTPGLYSHLWNNYIQTEQQQKQQQQQQQQ